MATTTSESDAARAELGELENEIARVKALLRELGLPSSTSVSAATAAAEGSAEGDAASGGGGGGVVDSTDHTNALTIAWISVRSYGGVRYRLGYFVA
jgi:hypothetical protein